MKKCNTNIKFLIYVSLKIIILFEAFTKKRVAKNFNALPNYQ